ncbi:MAG: diaminopimelate decarboxylase family protein, partial [Acutalibacteraceae bacterium]
MICKNLEIKNNTLYFGGRNTKELAEKYGTALYVMDEATIRENCRKYVNAFNRYFSEGSRPYYASKACSFKKIYNIVESEGMGVDVVSAGEIYTAKSAGFNLENACFHSNCKSDSDIIFAMEQGVGCFVVDNKEELDAISKFAGQRKIKQKILFRLTPGIDTHTYDAVNTGKVDSKFGFPIETGAALEITEYALTKENIDFKGFHCHVGSQLFESSVFIRSAEIMLNFIAEVKEKTGFVTEILDLGGGYGVRYTEDDPEIDIEDNIRRVAEFIKEKCRSLNINVPSIYME